MSKYLNSVAEPDNTFKLKPLRERQTAALTATTYICLLARISVSFLTYKPQLGTKKTCKPLMQIVNVKHEEQPYWLLKMFNVYSVYQGVVQTLMIQLRFLGLTNYSVGINNISTRRLACLPASVALLAIGLCEP